MKGLTRELKALLAVFVSMLLLGGCLRPMSPTPTLDTAVPPLTGVVHFSDRTVQADMTEVATSATVSLIESATNVTISSSVTDANGNFSLAFGGGFKPDKTKAYFLEAVKGLSGGGDANRAGASLARVRTLIYWRSGQWKSLTRQGVIVNRSSTALSVIANLRTAAAMPVDTEALIASVNVGVADATLAPTTPDTFVPGATQIGNDEYHQVFGLVSEALARDTDPLFSVSMDLGPPRRYVRTDRGFTVEGVAPTTGKSLDTVTVSGYGFNPTPSDNVVRFNGWPGTVLSVSADRRTLSVRVPGRMGISGPVSVQLGNVVQSGPTWTQNGWQESFDTLDNLKDVLSAESRNGAMVLTATNPTLAFVDTKKADFQGGQVGGLGTIAADPIDGGDGAVTMAISPLKVLQIYPTGARGTPDGTPAAQLVVAQGVYNYRPDLFEIDLLSIDDFNLLASLDTAFNATKVNKSSTTPGAIASLGAPVGRTMRYYDILFFGAADAYDGKDLSVAARPLTRSFAQLGRGVLFSHDTMVAGTRPGFQSLTDVHGLGIHSEVDYPRLAGSTVYRAPGVNPNSRILKQPFDVSVSSFPIISSHTLGQNTTPGASVWFAYDSSTIERAQYTPYWTSFTTPTSNSAFFSYGHTLAVPAEYEAKAMINSMYYTFDRGTEVRATFISRAHDSTTSNFSWKGGGFSWVASRPSEYAKIQFQVAATNDPNAVSLTYVGPDGTANTYFTTPGATLPNVTGRYLRYQASLVTNSIASVPVLSRVDVGGTFSNATSVVIAPNSLTSWGSLSFSPSVPGNQAIRLQVLDKDGVPLPESALAGNTAGFSTSPINLATLPANNNPALRVRILLLKQDAVMPQIDHLQLTWTP
ncbi:hypothetical protein D3C87_600140 [compost metagenome]